MTTPRASSRPPSAGCWRSRSSSSCWSSSSARSGSSRRPPRASSSGSAGTTRPSCPGLNLLVPFIDRVRPLIDMREQVVSFPPQPVITEDNLVVSIDTVIYFQVTDPRAATYEIAQLPRCRRAADHHHPAQRRRRAQPRRGAHQPRRDQRPAAHRARRGDRQVGHPRRPRRAEGHRPAASASRTRWRSRCAPSATVARSSSPPRARSSPRSSTAEGARQAEILEAEGDKQAAVLRAQGEAEAIQTVFSAIHLGNPDDKLLAYQYLQTLPKIADSASSKLWIIPSEFTEALKGMSGAFAGDRRRSRAKRARAPARGARRSRRCRDAPLVRGRSRASRPRPPRAADGGGCSPTASWRTRSPPWPPPTRRARCTSSPTATSPPTASSCCSTTTTCRASRATRAPVARGHRCASSRRSWRRAAG